MEVIDQIRGYLSDVGCSIGVITNGKQFIIANFINTNGIPWKQNKCIIYNGIDDIQNNYIRLSHYRYYPEGGRYSVIKTFTYSGRFIGEEKQDPEENIL